MRIIELIDDPTYSVHNVAEFNVSDGHVFAAGMRDGNRLFLALGVGTLNSLHLARLDAHDLDELQRAIDNVRLANHSIDTRGCW